jgi:multidrug efflux pump subunit AcrA (membrane-fusion protein)
MMGRVWLLVNGQLQYRDLRIGRSDGRMTEVVAGNLRRGDKVVTDIQREGVTPPAPAPASR